MRAQSFAVGSSWGNYKLRAFADGSLKIQNATITVAGGAFTINLDTTNGFKVTGNAITTTITNGTGFFGVAAGVQVQNIGNSVSCTHQSNGIQGSFSSGGNAFKLLAGLSNASLELDDTLGNSVVLFPATTASASAGLATLPSNPVGFQSLTINGTLRKVPYYAI